jgi:hypothetical protein
MSPMPADAGFPPFKPGRRDRGEATMNVWPEVRASGRSAGLQPREILPNAWGTDRV